jgi:DNA polymerase-3 subunit gamma/tau
MSYQVLARKWRPKQFSEMVGQQHVLQALVNALDSQRLHHAYLFTGTRGVGKTTIARIFSKSLNCEQGISASPCGECSACKEVDEGRSVDLIEIDAASRTGVDDMRELLENVQYAPTRARFKVYLIDEVHMLSKSAFNALLKTLEEPPEHIKFLLATTDPQKLPVTVLSRCLQFNLKRMTPAQIKNHLQQLLEIEKVETDEPALMLLAHSADGSMRDALSLLDQAIAFGAGAVKAESVESMLGAISRDYLLGIIEALIDQDTQLLLQRTRQLSERSPDFQRVCADLMLVFYQMALFLTPARIEPEDGLMAEQIKAIAQRLTPEQVQLYYQILLQGRKDLDISPDHALGFEMLMIRLLAFSPMTQATDASATTEKKSP